MKKVIARAVLMLAICLSFHPCKAQNDKSSHYILSKKIDGVEHIFSDGSDTSDAKCKQAVLLYNAGICYYKGDSVEQNYRLAVRCFQVSSEMGLVASQYAMGLCYLYGRGVRENDSLAFRIFKKSAELGYPASWSSLGLAYMDGRGTKKNMAEAIRCWQKAADIYKDGSSMLRLGQCYLRGEGVFQDKEEAFKLFNTARVMGSNKAIYNMAQCYEKGYGVEVNSAKAAELYAKVAGKK